jgi:GntR family transcriptional regulator
MASANPRPDRDLAPVGEVEGIPLYRLVKRALLSLVERGGYAPGEALPNETQLAGALKVSIGTLRKAVDELVHEHLLVRRQGKGTYVAMHGNERFLFQFFHVEPREPGSRAGREYPLVECVGFDKGRANEDEAQALGMRVGDAVLRIGNRLNLSGRPVVYDSLCLSARLFKGLTEKRYVDRPSTVYNLYQAEHGITVLRAQERARAVAAGREAARVLGLAPGVPVLEVHRVALSFGDKPVEYRISTIHTLRHDYVSMLSKNPA